MYDVAVVGCGIVGAAAAYELSRYRCKVLVLEAKNDVANVTTKANSAILHAGYDPLPGTLMAELNVRGVALARELCKKLNVEREEIGSLVLAFGEEDDRHLETLYRQGLANGVPELELLTADEARALDPNISEAVTGALYAPSAAIVSPWEYALALAETAVVNGCDLHLSAPVPGWRTATACIPPKAILKHATLEMPPACTVIRCMRWWADTVLPCGASAGNITLWINRRADWLTMSFFNVPTKRARAFLSRRPFTAT